MKCTKCRNYSFAVRRCSLGKCNPPSIKGGVDAARWFGITYICGVGEENRKKKDKIMKKLLEERERERERR